VSFRRIDFYRKNSEELRKTANPRWSSICDQLWDNAMVSDDA